jgi:PAS domain S-box-containing protein
MQPGGDGAGRTNAATLREGAAPPDGSGHALDLIEEPAALLDREGNVAHANPAWLAHDEAGALVGGARPGEPWLAHLMARGRPERSAGELADGALAVLSGAREHHESVWAPPGGDGSGRCRVRVSAWGSGGALVCRSLGAPPRAPLDLEQLEHLFELSQDGLVVASLEGFFQRVNPAFREILGYSEEELLRVPFLDLVHPRDVEPTRKALARLNEGEVVVDFVNRYRAADGTWRRIEWRSTPITEEGNCYAVARDVTEQHREAELVDEAQRTARIGGWQLDFETEELYWTAETYRIHETSPEEYTPSVHTAIAFYAPESIPAITEAVERARGSGEPWHLELELITARGNRIWVLATGLVRMEGGQAVKAFGAFQDITERKRTELERERLRAVLVATPDFVGMASADGMVEYVNPAGRALCGFAPDARIQGRISQFHPEWTNRRMVEEWLPHAAREGVWSGESALLVEGGREVPVSQAIIAHRDAAGEVAYFSTIVRDLSERKQLEERLVLGQKNASLGRMAGGIAHDFNNLLTVILGNAELAAASLPATGEVADHVAEIRAAGERAATLTAQLLAYARRQVFHPEVVDLNKLVLGAGKLLRGILGEGVELETRLVDAPWSTELDPGQFEQILVNLAINARDAMGGHGSLVLATRNVELDHERARRDDDLEPGEYVELEFTDTGEGMPPEVLQEAFEPFFTTRAPGEGTGLGLSTCQGIVRQSGGSITAESEPDRGTTIRIFLPRAADGAPAPNEQQAPATEDPAAPLTGTVLVVEDEPNLRRLARTTLERGGLTVLEAESCAEAIRVDAAHGERLDVALVDLELGDGCGRQLARQLATIRPDLAVLYCSGRPDAPPGAPFLAKPYGSDALLGTVREVLRGQGGSGTPPA